MYWIKLAYIKILPLNNINPKAKILVIPNLKAAVKVGFKWFTIRFPKTVELPKAKAAIKAKMQRYPSKQLQKY